MFEARGTRAPTEPPNHPLPVASGPTARIQIGLGRVGLCSALLAGEGDPQPWRFDGRHRRFCSRFASRWTEVAKPALGRDLEVLTLGCVAADARTRSTRIREEGRCLAVAASKLTAAGRVGASPVDSWHYPLGYALIQSGGGTGPTKPRQPTHVGLVPMPDR